MRHTTVHTFTVGDSEVSYTRSEHNSMNSMLRGSDEDISAVIRELTTARPEGWSQHVEILRGLRNMRQHMERRKVSQ